MFMIYAENGESFARHVWVTDPSGFNYRPDVIALRRADI